MNRYIRLETMWDASPWLDILSAEAQLVWVKLLCYAKGHGWDGRVAALSPSRAARMWNVGEESVRQLLKAAELHKSIAIDGENWVITHWAEYQGDPSAAARMRKFREPKTDNVTDVTRNARNVTQEKTNKEKRKKPPISPKGDKAVAPLPPIPEDLLPLRTALENFIEHRKEIKHPLTARALELVFAKARKWGFARTLQSIEDSIQGGYQGLFEPRRVSDITGPQLSREERRRLTS